MFRYAVFVWDPADSAQQETVDHFVARLTLSSTTWTTALDHLGLKVLHTGSGCGPWSCHRLAGHAGVVLGALFSQSNCCSAPVPGLLSNHESDTILASAGRHLVTTYWGSYVAVLNEPGIHVTRLLRSPVGTLPCLSVQASGVEICVSQMSDLVHMGFHALSTNWVYVAGYILKMSDTGQTGFNEVSAVRAGECLELVSGTRRTIRYWSPLDVAMSDRIESEDEAVRRLRDTTKACVHSWVRQYRRVLHNLSGGLDSSIVLGCLRDAPSDPMVTCVNYHSPGADSDERSFARAASEFSAVSLVERLRDPNVRFEETLAAGISERPEGYVSFAMSGTAQMRLAQEYGATAIFSGHKGDQLFYRNEARLTAADYVHDRGIGGAFFSTALSAAHLEGLSLWKIAWDALKTSGGKVPWDPIAGSRRHNTLLDESKISGLLERYSPVRLWYDENGRVPPGKQFHIYTLLSPAGYSSSLAANDDAQYVMPLMSQPLVELCLRIPTYILTNHGWDRSAARQAFANDVPRSLLRRRSKGGMEEFAKEVFRRNFDFVRDLLLNGHLAQEGLVDRGRLAHALSGTPSSVMKGMAKLLQLLDIEIWLHTSSTHRASLAARPR